MHMFYQCLPSRMGMQGGKTAVQNLRAALDSADCQ